jgi:hypothetical protein
MKLAYLVLFIIFVPGVNAQEILIKAHNLSYTLGENDFLVEENIHIENVGGPTGNLFRDSIYFARGDAQDVEVEVIGEPSKYSVFTSNKNTIITVNLTMWRGEKRWIILKYRRTDMLFRGENINVLSGLALGKYPWIPGRVYIEFKTPVGYQFGNITPPADKTLEGGREKISYEAIPITIKDLSAIRDGFPVKIEYANYKELAEEQIKKAEDFILEAEFIINDTRSGITNAAEHNINLSNANDTYNKAYALLEKAKDLVVIARIKNNPEYPEYSPYEAYISSTDSIEYARDSYRLALQAKNLANLGVQSALERQIEEIGKSLDERIEGLQESPIVIKSEEKSFNINNFLAAFIAVILALSIGMVYVTRSMLEKRKTLQEFRVINNLKRRTFTGFEKKIETVNKRVSIAKEIRDLKKEKEKMDIVLEELRRKKASGEITGRTYNSEKKRVENKINDIMARLYELEKALKELKKVK